MFSFFKRDQSPDVSIIRLTVEKLTQNWFLIEDVKISGKGSVIVVLCPIQKQEDLEIKRQAVESAIKGIKYVQNAMVILTEQKEPSLSSQTTSPTQSKQKTSHDISGLPPVVIAVASGKGGVGKSTVAVNLAIALSQQGKKVGILDADIYGPSLPRLLGAKDAKSEQGEDGRLQPISAHGLKAMSMGFLVSEETAMIWRGPMAQSALLQMLRDVNWDGLDILVIDMPPGTGDIHLTLAQRVPLSGGVVVSTPQDIALIDARKGLEMFKKVAVPILGIVENMSYYCCPSCGHREDIFGHGGARDEAQKIGVPFLGEIPLHGLIRSMSDSGTPVTSSATQSEQAKAFQMIAANVISGIAVAQRPAPVITIEE